MNTALARRPPALIDRVLLAFTSIVRVDNRDGGRAPMLFTSTEFLLKYAQVFMFLLQLLVCLRLRVFEAVSVLLRC